MRTKPTLLILPGWGGNTDTWKPFITQAQGEYHAVCLNLPCFGDEPCPREVWGVEEYAAYVEKKLYELSIGKSILVGHSFGGQIAARLVADHPEKFSGLVLIGAAAIRPRRPLRRFFFYLLAKTGKALFRVPVVEKKSAWAKHLLYRLTGSHDYESASGMKRDIFRRIIRQDMRSALPYIRIPTLVLWGAKDGFVPLRYGEKMAKRIPGAHLSVIPEGRHGLHLQDPHLLLRHIHEFTKTLN